MIFYLFSSVQLLLSGQIQGIVFLIISRLQEKKFHESWLTLPGRPFTYIVSSRTRILYILPEETEVHLILHVFFDRRRKECVANESWLTACANIGSALWNRRANKRRPWSEILEAVIQFWNSNQEPQEPFSQWSRFLVCVCVCVCIQAFWDYWGVSKPLLMVSWMDSPIYPKQFIHNTAIPCQQQRFSSVIK